MQLSKSHLFQQTWCSGQRTDKSAKHASVCTALCGAVEACLHFLLKNIHYLLKGSLRELKHLWKLVDLEQINELIQAAKVLSKLGQFLQFATSLDSFCHTDFLDLSYWILITKGTLGYTDGMGFLSIGTPFSPVLCNFIIIMFCHIPVIVWLNMYEGT